MVAAAEEAVEVDSEEAEVEAAEAVVVAEVDLEAAAEAVAEVDLEADAVAVVEETEEVAAVAVEETEDPSAPNPAVLQADSDSENQYQTLTCKLIPNLL